MAQYTVILANEYNAVQSTVANVLGTGSSGRGYGASVTSSQVTAGATITKAHFDNLRTDIDKCYNHIANSPSSVTNVVSGNNIAWSNIVTYQVAATYVDTNRDTNGGAITQTFSQTTLPSGWGNASGNRIATMNGTYNFSSANAMRYFFNQGSSLYMNGSGQQTGNGDKSNMFGSLVTSVSLTFSQGNYRAGNAPSQSQNGSTSPYNAGTPDNVTVSIGAPSGTTIPFNMTLTDKGNDGTVASNVSIALTFTLFVRSASGTSGMSDYSPSINFGSWSYAA
jgi:hypothetical protein